MWGHLTLKTTFKIKFDIWFWWIGYTFAYFAIHLYTKIPLLHWEERPFLLKVPKLRTSVTNYIISQNLLDGYQPKSKQICPMSGHKHPINYKLLSATVKPILFQLFFFKMASVAPLGVGGACSAWVTPNILVESFYGRYHTFNSK